MRIALASYRSKPHSGGQGIYVSNLSRSLVDAGHEVTVFSGPPLPNLDARVRLEVVDSLDLYRDDDPFRHPSLREFWNRCDPVDLVEYAGMLSGAFPEPRTFGIRLARLLGPRIHEFDVLHDNQTLAPGILRLAEQGLPTLTTIHHPISADRRLEIAAAKSLWRRYSVKRWYSFVAMQKKVAAQSQAVLTVSETSRADIIADFGVAPENISVVPVGVDVDTFQPQAASQRIPGRISAVLSATSTLKGWESLVQALTLMPAESWQECVIVGTPNKKASARIAQAGIAEKVTWRNGLSHQEIAHLLASAMVHVVPSLYEGFSLPAVEAMSAGTPLVATRVGALPQLVEGQMQDHHGAAGLLVEPGKPPQLAAALGEILANPLQGAELGAVGRRRAVETYSWAAVAAATVELYRQVQTTQGSPISS